MAVQKITIREFLELGNYNPVFDVRSPGEYNHAHIPGACHLPLFTDEERKKVGTAYKQDSRESAIKIGLDYFGGKMRKMVEEVEGFLRSRDSELKDNQFFPLADANRSKTDSQTVLVHCWRGGMRSAGVAWLLDLYGFKVFTLTGGYKAYRKWVRQQFEEPYNVNIIGGYTGSGKTLILHQLKREGHSVIDLEGIGNHKGSAFGALGQSPQPSQEMFENLLATALFSISRKPIETDPEGVNNIQLPANVLDNGKPPVIYIEDESQRIGSLNIPTSFWNTMRNSPVIFLEIPFEERLNYLEQEYGKFEMEKLVNAVLRIKKRLGGLETKTAINFLLENNHKECFRILLAYYDKWYGKALLNRDNLPSLLNKLSCNSIDVKSIVKILTNEKTITL